MRECLAAQMRPHRDMDRSTHFDIAVIGAGIAGASAACTLAQHRSVLLLERESQPGYHTTGRSAATFVESYGPPAVRALTRASREFYLAPPDGFVNHPLLAKRGALVLARPGEEHHLEREFADLAPTCPGLLRLSRAEAMALVPCLRPEQIASAMLDQHTMDIDVHALHQGYLRTLRKQGGVLRTSAHVVSARRIDAVWEITLAGQPPIRAAVVVNAAGAWADEVGAQFGAQHIGLVPHRRTAFTFAAPQGIATAGWPAVFGVDESYYFKPEAGTLLGSPANADPVHAHDVVPEELDVAIGIHHIEAVTTLQIRRPLRSWAGLRSFVPDGEMVIGWDRHSAGFFWIAGQGGYGIQSAPGAAALAAALLLGHDLPDSLRAQAVDPAALSPARLG